MKTTIQPERITKIDYEKNGHKAFTFCASHELTIDEIDEVNTYIKKYHKAEPVRVYNEDVKN